jgi:hypothetical protein
MLTAHVAIEARMRSCWGTVLTLSAVLATACSSLFAPYQQYEIHFDAPAARPLGENPSDSELLDSIASLMRNRLDLPFPPDIKAYVYVNQAAFVDGLVEIAGETSEEAGKQRSAFGIATRAGLFLRGDLLARMNLAGRASLFAHELTHISQNRLREGGRARPAQWILEGHAEWVKFKVVDLLGYRAYAESRDIMLRAALGSTITAFPDLPTLATNAAWLESTRRNGAMATYGQAFLAIDWLVERYGSAKLLEFLGRFALDADPQEHWRTVFPISYRQFADEFRARLEGLSLPTPPASRGS